MTDALWNISLNLVASFIFAGIVWLWQNRGNKRSIPSLQPSAPPAPSANGTTDHRARNRQALNHAAHRFLFYFVTFATLYLSITMPPLVKALFAKEQVLLTHARFVGEYLPQIPIGKDYLQVVFFAVAGMLYFPLLLISEFTASLIYPLIDKFRPVTHRLWSAAQMLVFLFFCVPIAATSVWLFYEKSFENSLLTVLLALFIPFAIGQTQGNRR